MKNKILVTGANSGFGWLAVQSLLGRGHTVVASMRDVKGRNATPAAELRDKGAIVVEIDVTQDDSVQSGVAAAITQADGLDVLVNNAGIGVHGLQEMFTPDDMKALFEVNVFGVQRMNRAVLKQFHEQKSGLLLHVSSILGRMTFPFYGPYNASKWAVEALAENYRTELSAFGIDVGLIEPGGFPTDFFGSMLSPSDESSGHFYGDFVHAPKAALEGFDQALSANPEQKPQLVADAIADVIETPAGQRPFRTVVDKMGMGDHIAKYNEYADQVTHGIYDAFDMADMLKLKS